MIKSKKGNLFNYFACDHKDLSKNYLDDCENFFKTSSTHKCEKCSKQFDLDEGFLNIGDICDASNEKINNYEKINNVDFSNFWCITCGSKTLIEVEK